jgi:uncharacterized membrane protein
MPRMNPIEVHLALNHVPVLATLFALGLIVFGLAARREGLLRVGLVFLVLSAVATVLVSLSGEEAEEIVEERVDAPETFIHEHEEAAEPAVWGAYALGVLALFGLVGFRARALPGWFTGLVLIGTLAAGALLLRAANLGGQIEHQELRGDTPALEAPDS